jgi:AcrR family transcriptional regulator
MIMFCNEIMGESMRSRRDDHTDATIAALLRAARRRFGKSGFEATGLDQIAEDARVTTGAVYHHFKSKKGLFVVVAEQIEAELLARANAVRDPDPWSRTRRAFGVLIDACATAEVQQILFLDAPRVVGPEAWREIELKYAYGGMSEAFTRLIQSGLVRPYPVELVAPVLLAVLAETSRAVAAKPEVRESAVDLLLRVLDALRVD